MRAGGLGTEARSQCRDCCGQDAAADDALAAVLTTATSDRCGSAWPPARRSLVFARRRCSSALGLTRVSRQTCEPLSRTHWRRWRSVDRYLRMAAKPPETGPDQLLRAAKGPGGNIAHLLLASGAPPEESEPRKRRWWSPWRRWAREQDAVQATPDYAAFECPVWSFRARSYSLSVVFMSVCSTPSLR